MKKKLSKIHHDHLDKIGGGIWKLKGEVKAQRVIDDNPMQYVGMGGHPVQRSKPGAARKLRADELKPAGKTNKPKYDTL